MITSYHQCHYRKDHTAPFRVNMGHMFICEHGGRGPDALIHGPRGQRHLWPQGETFLSPPRFHATLPLWLRQ